MELRGLHVLVIGMGQSGLAAVDLLRRKGAIVSAADSKALEALTETSRKLEEWGVPLLPQADALNSKYALIVLSPGVPADLPALAGPRSAGTRIVGEVEVAAWDLRGPVAGITGTNGKTTTTALTGHILEQCGIPCQVGGNIGLAPTAMVEGSRPEQWNVLELSSFQLETTESLRVQIAAVLNITPDHLDRHYTVEQYAAVKARIFHNQQPGDHAVLNAGDAWAQTFASKTPAQVTWFSLERPVKNGLWLEGDWIVANGERLLRAAEAPLLGRHNLENAMAAAAIALLAGASMAPVAAAIRSFPGVEHRLELVGEINGVRYFNDSKATNVDAALKALDAFDGGLWVILGGRDKGSDYRPLRQPLERKAKAALLVGECADILREHLQGAAPLIGCGTLERATAHVREAAAPGDTVLLAPAAASYDQFQNYEHRGRRFKQLVQQLKEKAYAHAPSAR